MKRFNNYITAIVALALAFVTLSLHAQDLPVPNQPEAWVNDYAGTFRQDEARQLNNKLAAFEQRSSTQIFVVTLTDSKGYEPGDLAQRIGEKWHVGQKDKDNGIVLLVDMTAHKTFIATGYGVEEYIPDAVSKRIVEQEMIPAFKQGDYYGGVNKAVDVMIDLLEGKFTADQYIKKSSSGGGSSVAMIIIMIILFSIFFGGGRNRRSVGMGSRSNLPLWIALGMLNSGRGSGGSWGGFSGGGGGFGGGGFSGGGGGSFGGGGAGGSW